MTPSPAAGTVANSLSNTVLRSRDINGIRFSTVRYMPGTERIRSKCPDGQFWLVLRGGWQAQIFSRGSIQCPPLSLSYYLPGEKNRRVVGAAGATLFGIQIPTPDKYPDGLFHYPDQPVFESEGRAGVIALRLFQASTQEDSAASLILEELLLELTRSTLRRAPSIPDRNEPRWIAQARELLHARQTEPVSLGEVAEACGIHPVYLTAAFRRQFGCTMGEYLRRLRVEASLRLLCGTDEEVGAIAHRLGFYDQAHFNRVFKAQIGIAPGALRQIVHKI